MPSEMSKATAYIAPSNPGYMNKTLPVPSLREFSLAIEDTNPIKFEDIFSSLLATRQYNESDRNVVLKNLGLNLSVVDLGEVFKENNRNSITAFRLVIHYIDLYVVPLVGFNASY